MLIGSVLMPKIKSMIPDCSFKSSNSSKARISKHHISLIPFGIKLGSPILCRDSLVVQLVKKNPLQCRRPQFNSLVRKIPWRKDGLPTPVFMGFSGGSAGNESGCSTGDLSSIPGLGRSPGEGNGYPLQYSGLENSMNCIVRGVTRVGHD